MSPLPRHLLPMTARVVDGQLEIGGCDVLELAERFGTPAFVYDEAHLRERCREVLAEFGEGATYASKAFLCSAMARLVHEEGLRIDVATGGELHVDELDPVGDPRDLAVALLRQRLVGRLK